ncbi:hypothetical protein PI125_g14240 [Phytophthora idaei]|nr:hypothetical protein PI125_g14240 [Phytophthora idaei]
MLSVFHANYDANRQSSVIVEQALRVTLRGTNQQNSKLRRLVCAYLPKRNPDWELVVTAYNSTRKSQWKDRDAASLKTQVSWFVCANRMLRKMVKHADSKKSYKCASQRLQQPYGDA